MSIVVVRVWLPDRPGALGQVATRIGAAGGDVVGIEILERGGGSAIDELVVSLPDGVLLQVLLTEIALVEGVAIEDVREVDETYGDTGLVVLEIAATVLEAPRDHGLKVFCEQLLGLVDGDWVVARTARSDSGNQTAGHASLLEFGVAPDVAWLGAFIDGVGHLSGATHVDGIPGDVVWVHLESIDVAVVAGRSTRPFHARERQQVTLLGRIVDARMRLPEREVQFLEPVEGLRNCSSASQAATALDGA